MLILGPGLAEMTQSWLLLLRPPSGRPRKMLLVCGKERRVTVTWRRLCG
jgi:hypothetical protein